VFSAVTTNTVLQHLVDDTKLQMVFAEISRILDTGGAFLASELISPISYYSGGHVKLRTLAYYRQLATATGLNLTFKNRSVSTFGTMQTIYNLMRKACGSKTKASAHSEDLKPISKSKNETKRSLRALAVGVSKAFDKALHLLRLDFLLINQVTMCFSKNHSAS